MYPYQHVWIDREAFDRSRDLLAAAGMAFTVESRSAFPWLEGEPPITDVFGHLDTPLGPVPCRLRNTMNRQFDLRIPLRLGSRSRVGVACSALAV
jgi:hypothetical protein